MAGSTRHRMWALLASTALLVALVAGPAAAAIDAPASPVTIDFAQVADLQLDGVATTVVRVLPGALVTVSATSTDVRTDCPTCFAFLPTGLEGADQPAGCLLEAALGTEPSTMTQTRSVPVTAPATAGVYDVVASYEWTYTCAEGWDGTGTTIARIVVALPPAIKSDCKKGGWRELTTLDAQPFRNQGRCVSYFNHVIR